MVTGGSAMFSVIASEVAVCTGALTSVTLNVRTLLAWAVGVPEIKPVVEFSVRPAGNTPEATCQLNGGVPPVAARD